MHPEEQEELFQEIRSEMKNENEIHYESLKKLKFLDAVLKESQRVYTTSSIVGRECDEDTLVRGVPIQKVRIISLNF